MTRWRTIGGALLVLALETGAQTVWLYQKQPAPPPDEVRRSHGCFGRSPEDQILLDRWENASEANAVPILLGGMVSVVLATVGLAMVQARPPDP